MGEIIICSSLSLWILALIISLTPTATSCCILSWWYSISNSLLWLFIISRWSIVIEIIKHKVHIWVHIFHKMVFSLLFLIHWYLKIFLLILSRWIYLSPRLWKIVGALWLLYQLHMIWLRKLLIFRRQSWNMCNVRTLIIDHCRV